MNNDELMEDPSIIGLKNLRDLNLKILDTLSIIASALEGNDKEIKLIKSEIEKLTVIARLVVGNS